MKNAKIQQLYNAIDFSNELVNDVKNNFVKLLELVNDFDKVYKKEEKKLPYHINLIDELRANENAHSRILEKLLQQQEPTNKKYEILESFLKYIIENHCKDKKTDFCNIKIKKPQITQEKKRIDLWIRDADYAIILENKIGWAKDQSNQLERYIETTKNNDFKEEQIYVLYLPPTNEKEPNEQTWGRFYKSEIHEKRYLRLSFKDDILPWLKNSVLPNIRLKDKYFSSAIEQYIDHLEGKFNLRTINNEMNMKLQRFIKEKLGINSVDTEKAFEIVSEKIEEMENALKQLNLLREQIQKEIDEKYFSECFIKLEQSGYNVVREIDGYLDFQPTSVGVLVNNLIVWIGKGNGRFFCQLNANDSKKPLLNKVKKEFKDVMGEEVGEYKNGTGIWTYFEDGDEALYYLIEICKKLNNKSK